MIMMIVNKSVRTVIRSGIFRSESNQIFQRYDLIYSTE